ncbi:MAG: trehalase family glycosidase [Deinococcales bacterium]
MEAPTTLDGPFPDDEELRDFLERARHTLTANDVGDFVKPGLHQYPHQWNWDAALVAMGLAHFDAERARKEVRSLLRGQWLDGMLPHVVYHNGSSDYFPGPDFWQIEQSVAAPPGVRTSGLVQPPLLATCVRRMHRRAADREASLAFVREVYPKLLRWHRWLHRARDPEGTGLVAIVHPWESGTDNAARFVQPLMQVTPARSQMPVYQRRDSDHVAAEERPVHADYERFVYLIDQFRRWGYDPETMYARSPFLVQDTLFNAVVYQAHEDMIALADEIGEPTAELERWRFRLRRAFNNKLWDDEEGLYFAYDARHHQHVRENGVATFLALYAGLADRASQAKNNYFYEPRRYWRGPVWILINWMIMEGLERYGYRDLGERVRLDSVALMRRSGFYEYYDPRDGSPAGASDFSWSAALALEMLEPLPLRLPT